MKTVIEIAKEAGFETLISKKRIYGYDLDGDYTEKLEHFAKLVRDDERNTLAAWMIQFGFATGHGDTMEQLVDALGSEIVDRIECEIDTEREACAKVCEQSEIPIPLDVWHGSTKKEMTEHTALALAKAIRARGNP